MGLYRGLAVGSEILAVVLGSLVLLAGTEWPFYPAGLLRRSVPSVSTDCADGRTGETLRAGARRGGG